MLFNSIGFLIFFPIVVLIYFALQSKYRNIWLLLASYYFYACWSVEYAAMLFLTTLVTYLSARFMNGKYKKIIFSGCLTLNICILMGIKFFNIGAVLLGKILEVLHMSLDVGAFSVILPVGMSFYMFQSLGYLIDVYRGTTEVENNFVRYALFVSFFSTILSGPIERSGNLLKQIQKGTEFSYDNAKTGLLMMLFGYFEKILISNRIAPLVNDAYTNYESGSILIWAVILYGIQIYTDFAGYSYIARGTAKVLGFDIIENFKRPYFAVSIKEFWSRWHISLSQWLRDYVYFSLGGSRQGKFKTYRNLILTFLISGIWHGNGLGFIVWGLLHGIYQVVGRVTENCRTKFKQKLQINTICWSYRFFQGLITFAMVDFAWLFFSTSSLEKAFYIINQTIHNFNLAEVVYHKFYMLGMEESRFYLLLLEIAIVIFVDFLHEKKISIIEWLNKQNIVFRWGLVYFIIFVIVIGSIYNYGAEASAFIYTQF